MPDKKNKNTMGCAITFLFFFFIALSVFINIITENNTGSTSSTTSAEAYNSSGEFQLSFGDDFSKGKAIQDDLGLSVVIAMDCSGSMDEYPASGGNEKKYRIASESLTEIINFLLDFYKNQKIVLNIGLIKFDDEVNVLYPITRMDEAAFNKLIAITSNPENFLPDGKTALGRTLEKSVELVIQSGTIFKSIIIISDGENTEGIYPEDVQKAVIENRNNKNTPDFPVFTSSILTTFVGFDIEGSVFDTLHTYGARITSAKNKAELNESLKNIFIADITKLEGK